MKYNFLQFSSKKLTFIQLSFYSPFQQQKKTYIFEYNNFLISKNIQMNILLLTLLAITCTSIILPIHTDSQRCMVIYSDNQDDTIKINIKFPADPTIEQHYHYIAQIKDLRGNVVSHNNLNGRIYRTEVTVPDQTIYQACISIIPKTINDNQTIQSNQTIRRYHGEVLVQYEASSYFIIQQFQRTQTEAVIRQEEVNLLRGQANELINATRQFLQLQRVQREQQTKEYEQKRLQQQQLLEWWMLQLLVIVGLGVLQWSRMKNKLRTDLNH